MAKRKRALDEGFRINFTILLGLIIVIIVINTVTDYFFQYILTNPYIRTSDYFNWLFLGFFNWGVIVVITLYLFFYLNERVRKKK